MQKLLVRTAAHSAFVNITRDVQRVVAESGVRNGVCHVFVPHTTAGVTINEGADPDVARDILSHLDRLVPWTGGYAHAEGNAAAHVKATLVGQSATLFVEGGYLVVGTWQSVFLCEFDGPRQRTILVEVVDERGGLPGQP